MIGYFKIFSLEDLCSNAGQRPSVMHSMVCQRQLQHRQHVGSFEERNNMATRRLLKMLGVSFIIGSHDQNDLRENSFCGNIFLLQTS